MRKAVLYARVSTHLQEKEGTIESQLVELKRQIAKNGDELVKEYIDDGYSGAYLDRPALENLRAALKTDLFEAVYFLAPDRIARDPIHQDIIVNEILQYKKRVIINDKDYEKNPENEFALRVFGAVSQFERAKILERTQRGRLHHLRNGHLMPNGHTIYGYRYVRKTPDSPAKLVVHEEEAAVLRSMFEAYADGMGINALVRSLEERGIPARKGGPRWNVEITRRMLRNPTYTGIRYFNRMTRVEQKPGEPRKRFRRLVDRDRSEWIGVKVPAIIPQELFDRAQERLDKMRQKYRRPKVVQLLSGLLRCAECGHAYCSVRWYGKRKLSDGQLHVYHSHFYQCSMQMWKYMHARASWKPCRNSRITTHILEEAVVDTVRNTMLDPEKLLRCMERDGNAAAAGAARELVHIEARMKVLDHERQKLTDRYAVGSVGPEKYAKRNRVLDRKIDWLVRKRNSVVEGIREHNFNDRVRQFCANARANFQACIDFDSQRKFLQDHIEKIVFGHDKITLIGSIPAEGDGAALPFTIHGAVDRERVRSEVQKNRVGNEARERGWHGRYVKTLSKING